MSRQRSLFIGDALFTRSFLKLALIEPHDGSLTRLLNAYLFKGTCEGRLQYRPCISLTSKVAVTATLDL
ncbi:hypothetical protein LOC67_07165 [Stieleria sp. JC731]|uniref:hypothetical protein n=1 Tax=Pirellulaceae TaxID=2691357 RepID=UPI001E4EB2C8|nr:hypothetical protein [Stieleria sp. JC731]MCC9600336.1 hypothetical protein [Stieleria sp. JC731]